MTVDEDPTAHHSEIYRKFKYGLFLQLVVFVLNWGSFSPPLHGSHKCLSVGHGDGVIHIEVSENNPKSHSHEIAHVFGLSHSLDSKALIYGLLKSNSDGLKIFIVYLGNSVS